MSNIDERTGLPGLPEGLNWYVGEKLIRIEKKLPDTEWKRGFTELFTRSSDDDAYVRSSKATHEVPETYTVGQWVGDYFPRERQVTKTRTVKYYCFYDRHLDVYRNVFDTVNNEDNLVSRCEEVLAAYDSRETRKSLYGPYPPKKLEVQ